MRIRHIPLSLLLTCAALGPTCQGPALAGDPTGRHDVGSRVAGDGPTSAPVSPASPNPTVTAPPPATAPAATPPPQPPAANPPAQRPGAAPSPLPASTRGPGGGFVPPPPPTPGQKTEEYYSNIQVLKGQPADQLVPAMQFVAASLGVECEFCHVERAPEKDDKKEKQTARRMMTMTFAINRDGFEGKRQVTCYSCHRGVSKPLATPAVAAGERVPEAPQPGSGELPAARAILERYLQAAGGAEALGRITSRIEKGTMTGFGGEPLVVEVFAKAPDKRISIVHTPRGDSLTAFDGHGGWLGSTGRPPRDMSAAESGAARLDADLRFPSHVTQLFKEFTTAAAEKIDGRDALHVLARNEGEPPVELWFDAQSGLLVRLLRFAETPLGRNPTQIDYADYHDADGVKIPFRWSISRPAGRFTIQIEEVHQNVPVDDARFEKAPGV